MQPKVIRIDGVIGQGEGEVSAQWFRSQLPANGTDPISVKMHSEGGSVWEGFAIHDAAKAYEGPKSLSIESSAFSIASFIATAFDDVEIAPNGYMMLHNPRIEALGDDEALAKNADNLKQLKTTMVEAYASRSGRPEAEILAIMKAETYFNARDSVAYGFASRVAEKPVTGRAFARLDTLPHGVVAALFGAGPGGEKREPTKEKPMSESQPVAATVQEIRSAFPKAKSDFIVRCLERSLPMASVASAAAEELMKENEELQARIKAMEEEKDAESKAKAEEEEKAKARSEEEAKAKAEEEKEAEAKATARRTGAAPVAQTKGGKPSATARWCEAIQAKTDRGIPKAKAVSLVNRENPGLRESYLAEVNGR